MPLTRRASYQDYIHQATHMFNVLSSYLEQYLLTFSDGKSQVQNQKHIL